MCDVNRLATTRSISFDRYGRLDIGLYELGVWIHGGFLEQWNDLCLLELSWKYTGLQRQIAQVANGWCNVCGQSLILDTTNIGLPVTQIQRSDNTKSIIPSVILWLF